MDLLPLKATFAPGDPVAVELRGAEGPVEVELWRLDEPVAKAVAGADGVAVFPPQLEGGYGVEAPGARSALDVLADPLRRPRYGFVSRFEAGRDPAPVVENARRLHLNIVQFYDWMYRHAALLPPADDFLDPLGRELSLVTVRRLADALREVGSLSLGYAAVYAVGAEEWPRWRGAGLYRPDGRPWQLGEDFLWILDPADAEWSRHLADDLRRAAEAVGFAGFQLDQYGWPKRALRADGVEVDLAEAFVTLLGRLRDALPGVRLIFNNVNAYPLWATANAPQDVVYVEVWPPHVRLDHLAGLVERARALAPEKPIVLAAYLPVYGEEPEVASWTARLVMATVFSHGGCHLLLGEEGAVLLDPYFVKHWILEAEGVELFRRWYDFAVRYGDLLYDPAAVDVTRSFVGGVDGDVLVEAPVPVSTDAEPGVLWVRLVETAAGRVLHLIDLSAQDELAWDAPKRPGRRLEGVRLAVLRTGRAAPTFAAADPEGSPRLVRLEPEVADGYDVVELPPFQAWAFILLRS